MVPNRVLLALLLAPLLSMAVHAEKPTKKELKPVQGTWITVAHVVDGTEVPKKLLKKLNVIIAGDKMTQKPELVLENGKLFKLEKAEGVTWSVAIDGTRDPKHFDLIVTDKGQSFRAKGIFILAKDTLKISINPEGRPKDFTSKAGSGNVLFVLKRSKK